jgi:hypothetical protein
MLSKPNKLASSVKVDELFGFLGISGTCVGGEDLIPNGVGPRLVFALARQPKSIRGTRQKEPTPRQGEPFELARSSAAEVQLTSM